MFKFIWFDWQLCSLIKKNETITNPKYNPKWRTKKKVFGFFYNPINEAKEILHLWGAHKF